MLQPEMCNHVMGGDLGGRAHVMVCLHKAGVFKAETPSSTPSPTLAVVQCFHESCVRATSTMNTLRGAPNNTRSKATDPR